MSSLPPLSSAIPPSSSAQRSVLVIDDSSEDMALLTEYLRLPQPAPVAR
ncbi:MAG: hypothetical protein WBJ03_05040 [Moraxellaceae bacterium]